MDFQEFSGLQNDRDRVIHLWTIDVLIGSLDNSDDDDDFVVVHLSHQHRHPLLPGWVVPLLPGWSVSHRVGVLIYAWWLARLVRTL